VGIPALLLFLIVFYWTPPHFWALALRIRRDYAAAGVPMLPVVVGSDRAARVVLHSTVALVVASLLPGLFGAGWIYMVGAATGGSYFVFRAWQLARAPSRTRAMASFFASLVQLSLLLAAATVDALLR
jgi:protoheme IX farnesyltransferase